MRRPNTEGARTQVLVEAASRLAVARNLGDVRAVVAAAARAIADADGATVVFREGMNCRVVAEHAAEPFWHDRSFPIEACLSGWAILHREAVVIPDVRRDERIRPEVYGPSPVCSLAILPIRVTDPIGAVGVYWTGHHLTSGSEFDSLEALAEATGAAIDAVTRLGEADRARLATLRRLARTAEFHDDHTLQHTQRVARTSARLALQAGRPPEESELIRQTASLHDIGKLAVPDSILLKPGPLTREEYEQIQLHPASGAAMLAGSSSETLQLAAEIALSHHERWDGGGYPNGQVEHEIPLSGRIVAIADVFDSLTHVRPYKPAWPVEDAVAEIHRLSGSQFDPEMVDAFDRLAPATLLDGTIEEFGRAA